MAEKTKRLICLMLSICFLIMPAAAFAVNTTAAKEQIDTAKQCTLNAYYGYDGAKFALMEIKIYRVADVSADFQYTYASDFAKLQLPLNGIKAAAEWDSLRTSLDSYIAANSIKPTASAKTDAAGKAEFKGLKPGLYFIGMAAYSENGFKYYFYPALTALPSLDEQSGKWQYQAELKIKPEVDAPDDDAHDDVRYKVIKLWRNDKGAQRPKSIMVDIIRNNVTVRTVELNAENNWTYSWIADKDGSVWNVAERNTPSGYVSSVDKMEGTFLITNTIPNEKDNKPGYTNPKTGDDTNIALYIMLMCISGIVLTVLGITGRGKSK